MRMFGRKTWRVRLAVAMAVLSLGRIAPLAASADEAGALSLPPSRPVNVELSLELLEISQIQDHEEKFDVEFYLFLSWRDPRLAFDPDREGATKKVVAADAIWTPEPDLVDDLDVNVQGGKTAHVRSDGTVLYRQYYRGTVSSNFDLHEFPFDRHTLELNIEATSGDVGEVRYVAGDSHTRQDKPNEHARLVPHGWSFLGTSSAIEETVYTRLGETYSRFIFRVDIQRDPHYYWWAIVLPLLPIVAASWSVFWMDPKEFSSQVGVGVTAMLTVVAYRITIDSSLPPLTYMTRMDYFLLICQIFVFGSFLISVVAHVCFAAGTDEMVALARRINEQCRWLPPLLMTGTCLLLLLLRPALAMTLSAGTLVALLLLLRPTPRNLMRWFSVLMFPERLVEQRMSNPIRTAR